MRKLLVLLLVISFLPQVSQWHASATSHSTTPMLADDDPTPSPTPTPTPDVELEEKKRAAALAEEEKKREVAEKDAAEARLAKLKAETAPLGDATKVTVPTGSVTTDEGGFVEVEMLSQEAAREISNKVTKALCGAKFPAPFPVKDPAGHEVGTSNWTPTYATKDQKMSTLVIYDSSEVAALELYHSVAKQLENFVKEFDTKHKEKETLLKETDLEAAPPNASIDSPLALIAAPGVATGLIKSVAELINLFRTDTEFKNKKVTIPEDMVVSYVISEINRNCSGSPVVYYPHFYPPNLESDRADSVMLGQLETLGERKGIAAEDIKEITKRIGDINTLLAKLKVVKETPAEIAKKEAAKKKCKDKKCIADLNEQIESLQEALTDANEKIDELTNNKPAYFIGIVKDKKHEKWLTELNRLKSLTQFLIESADQVTTKLNTPDDTTKLTAVAQLLRAERLRAILSDPLAFTLRIAVTANGTTKIKKNIFVDAKVRHTAGANLVYQLFDHNGKLRRGDALQFYFDYMSANDVKNKVCEANSNCPPKPK
jgi:hypothetical protein